METQTTTEKAPAKNGATKDTNLLVKTERGLEAPVSALKVMKSFNVRQDATPSPELVASVKENGVQNPIHIRDSSEPGVYFLIDGERRYNAANKAKVDTVPVVYHGNMSDAEAMVLSLTANENQKSLSEGERAEGFRRLKAHIEEDEIARVMGVSVRTVKETLRALEKGVKEIKEGVKKAPEKGGIPTRVAARAADLPPKIQKQVAKEVKGKSTKEGLKVVQKAEKQIGKVQRGRKPTLSLARDAKKRVDQLEALIIDRLPRAGKNNAERMLAHLEAVWVLRGDREVKDVYLANGGFSKLPSTKEVIAKAEKAKAAAAPKAQPKVVAKTAKAPGKKKPKIKVAGKPAAKKAVKKAPASSKAVRKGAR